MLFIIFHQGRAGGSTSGWTKVSASTMFHPHSTTA